MPRSSLVALCVLLGATLAMPAAAQWKWRDHRGQVQYSDLPPPAGVADKDILQRPNNQPPPRASATPAAPAASAAAPTLPPTAKVDPELEARRKKAEQEEAAKEAEKQKAEEQRKAAARAENCKRAQAHLRSLDSGMRVARVAENGEREILDDAQRAAEAQRARAIVASECR